VVGTLLLGILLTAVVAWVAIRQLRRSRRRALFSAPFSGEWVRILKQNVSLYKLLPKDFQSELHGHINIFLDEKVFVGCGGLEITDEIRVTIAAQACILLLNRKTNYYPRTKTILVYPGAYIAREINRDGFVETMEDNVRTGESWHRGPVVLSWDDAKRGASDATDGENVVLHEFAHQLDQENDLSDGAPVLEHRSQYMAWAQILSREYDSLKKKIIRDHESVFDHYGATSPAEFFAVLTETFFETPVELKKEHPELYEEVKNFYKVDPIRWHSENPSI